MRRRNVSWVNLTMGHCERPRATLLTLTVARRLLQTIQCKMPWRRTDTKRVCAMDI